MQGRMERVLVFAVLTLGAIGMGRADQPTPQQKAAIPDAQAQEAAQKAASEIYAGRFQQAKTVADKTGLATEMINASSTFPAGSADQYVLLKIARDVAANAGDAPTAIQATEQLSQRFDVPVAKLKAESLLTAASRASLSTQHKAVAEAALDVVRALADSDDYENAISLCEAARSSAQKAKQIAIVKAMATKADELKVLLKAAQVYRDALAVMDGDPVEPTANLAAGRYLCFVKGDWKRGVPYLALGSDVDLKTVAVLDLRGATSADEQVGIGDAWWALADSKQGEERASLRLRAGYWYRQAEPNVPAGLGRLKVTQRLAEISKAAKPLTESDGHMFLSELEPHQVILHPTMAIGEAHTVENVQPAHGLFAHPPPNSSSSIAYNLPNGYRELTGTAAITDLPRDLDGQVATGSRTPLTFQVIGDGRMLWKSRPLQRSGDKQVFTVNVSGLRKLDLRVDCPGFANHAWAMWVDPVLSK